jgi:hypothetical protein
LEVHFVINAWAACAPGLQSQADWRRWAQAPWCPQGVAKADAKDMPAMARRRLNGLGRMAAEVGYAASAAVGIPTVFASRYGDASRSLELLAEMARGEAVSPTAFGLSVQNAIGAMVSMARGDQANMLAVAGGAASAAAGMVEAAALLHDGAPEVLLVHYDAALPQDYAGFHDEPQAAYAWAWRVAPCPRPGVQGFTLARTPEAHPPQAHAPALPLGLALLRSALIPGHCEQTWHDGARWRLQAHG